jgi:hypothetical protein
MVWKILGFFLLCPKISHIIDSGGCSTDFRTNNFANTLQSVTSEITCSFRLLNILYTRRMTIITENLQMLNITFGLHENRTSGNCFQGHAQ